MRKRSCIRLIFVAINDDERCLTILQQRRRHCETSTRPTELRALSRYHQGNDHDLIRPHLLARYNFTNGRHGSSSSWACVPRSSCRRPRGRRSEIMAICFQTVSPPHLDGPALKPLAPPESTSSLWLVCCDTSSLQRLWSVVHACADLRRLLPIKSGAPATAEARPADPVDCRSARTIRVPAGGHCWASPWPKQMFSAGSGRA